MKAMKSMKAMKGVRLQPNKKGGGAGGGGGPLVHVAHCMKNGKSIVICKDFNKPQGCTRQNCRFKTGHVCSVKGCHKPQPAHNHH